MKKTDRKKKKAKNRSAEIFSVFAKHNFYVNGFTPEELRTTLEDLGPTYVKIGQILSSRNDIFPESYCEELKKLRSEVRPLEASAVREVIEKETGRTISDIYTEFRDDPLGSASIAQAHYGVLKDGTKVVTKVQRPHVAEMMKSDFVILNRLASLVNIASDTPEEEYAVDLKSVLRELEKVTEAELDFRVEAENTRKFRDNCIEDDRVVSCPKIIDGLTTERILTMTFVDGYSIVKKDRVEEDGYDRVEIGKAIIENYMHQVLDIGMFHGDPHQGNILISRGVPYWIDFGMIGYVSEQNIAVIQDIVFSLLRRDVESLTNAVMSFGRSKNKINKAKLMDGIEDIINRYMSAKDLQSIDVGALMTDIKDLLFEHSIKVPGEYTMLVRSLITIEGVLNEFCPEINIFEYLTAKMIERAKANFDIREKLVSLIESLAVSGMNASKLPRLTFDALRNLAKGRTKLNFEITGYEEPLKQITELVKTVIYAVFSCVLFAGSCTLCTTDIQPQTNGIPLVALIGFVLSVALALYAVVRLTRRK
ncbi:MAG: AarF/ABC1/UbiB kinase family protein [Clostridia bacterium]|nr:AarF/ABC1/UbiB kinase family protein [Clostridia bacterium]